ncbi:hypothetical protein [Variovorax sp. YR216]|uniref:hypothetical protein n=1 Tax=Variovorax sp. YR216 TaxID=1882828 RepID=UPI000897EDD3|nr:hypothetical protein [Variovorax sp. YR216]SEB20391.1 hypothetical protein SAMN05444680_113125 [Variovorax sp. YR216]
MPSEAAAAARAALPPVRELLVSGGDHRIALDPVTGRNKYGCSPIATSNVVPFGSSTSSGISPSALAVVDALRDRLAGSLAQGCSPAWLYGQEMDRLRLELLRMCGIDASSGAGLVFAASGTDVHLLATRMARESHIDKPLAIITAGGSESGSGVPAALAGRHFSTWSALGRATVPGEPVGDSCDGEILDVPIRTVDGVPRDAKRVDAEVTALVDRAVRDGRRVLLVLMDLSKTGCIAPGIASVLEIRRRWGSAVQVLVDACQFRIEPGTLRAYLRCGFMVAVTGSKFLTGPPFSGALLLPPSLSATQRGHFASTPLRAYSAREEWPRDWPCAQALASHANFGLLMRWQAAIHELREFQAIPPLQARDILRRFAAAVQARLARDPCFAALPVPSLDRAALHAPSAWDGIQTIHPFLLHRPARGGARVPLGRDETAAIHRRMEAAASDSRAWAFQVGQPVDAGQRSGVQVSALRLCMSARLVVQAARDRDLGDGIIDQGMACLDSIAASISSRKHGASIALTRAPIRMRESAEKLAGI